MRFSSKNGNITASFIHLFGLTDPRKIMVGFIFTVFFSSSYENVICHLVQY